MMVLYRLTDRVTRAAALANRDKEKPAREISRTGPSDFPLRTEETTAWC